MQSTFGLKRAWTVALASLLAAFGLWLAAAGGNGASGHKLVALTQVHAAAPQRVALTQQRAVAPIPNGHALVANGPHPVAPIHQTRLVAPIHFGALVAPIHHASLVAPIQHASLVAPIHQQGMLVAPHIGMGALTAGLIQVLQ
jgi:hypothetical protein